MFFGVMYSCGNAGDCTAGGRYRPPNYFEVYVADIWSGWLKHLHGGAAFTPCVDVFVHSWDSQEIAAAFRRVVHPVSSVFEGSWAAFASRPEMAARFAHTVAANSTLADMIETRRMWLSQSLAWDLVTAHEAARGANYTHVVVARFDLDLAAPLNVAAMAPDTIYVSGAQHTNYGSVAVCVPGSNVTTKRWVAAPIYTVKDWLLAGARDPVGRFMRFHHAAPAAGVARHHPSDRRGCIPYSPHKSHTHAAPECHNVFNEDVTAFSLQHPSVRANLVTAYFSGIDLHMARYRRELQGATPLSLYVTDPLLCPLYNSFCSSKNGMCEFKGQPLTPQRRRVVQFWTSKGFQQWDAAVLRWRNSQPKPPPPLAPAGSPQPAALEAPRRAEGKDREAMAAGMGAGAMPMSKPAIIPAGGDAGRQGESPQKRAMPAGNEATPGAGKSMDEDAAMAGRLARGPARRARRWPAGRPPP